MGRPAFFHAEVAKLCGATQAEIEDAFHHARSSASWSTYASGLQQGLNLFKKEVIEARGPVCAQQKKS